MAETLTRAGVGRERGDTEGFVAAPPPFPCSSSPTPATATTPTSCGELLDGVPRPGPGVDRPPARWLFNPSPIAAAPFWDFAAAGRRQLAYQADNRGERS